MKKNIGTFDRAARIVAAVVFGILISSGVVEGTLAVILGIFGVTFLLTGFVGFCPLYQLLGLSTRKAT
jgi:amino acid transporter